MMKAQFSIEYFGSMLLFLIAVLGIASIGAGQIPQLRSNVHQASLNLEAYSVSTRLLTQPGYHDYSGGGTNWESSTATIDSVEEVGLANDYKVLSMAKVDALSTVGDDKLNYTLFKEALNLDNNYRFKFTWMPVITTSKSYIRSSPPNNSRVNISEPDSGVSDYWTADNEVHYSVKEFAGNRYCFLVVSHDGVYDTLYKTGYSVTEPSCDFSLSTPYKLGEQVTLSGHQFEITKFQNRRKEPGSFFILKKVLKEFGGSLGRNSRVVKLNRYAVLKTGNTLQPVKMEVWAW